MKKCCFLTSLLLCGFLFNAGAKQITVTASGMSFSPKSFTAAIGDTILFVRASGTHTTTSTSVPQGAATWDAPLNGTTTSFSYIIKVSGSYAFKCRPHEIMGMVGSFTVADVANVSVVKATSVNNCTNTNSLQYQCTQSKPPYKVQLFRYGKAIGSVRTVNNTMPFTFSNLQPGSYFATTRGNNGTDAVAGKSATSALMPVPAGVLAKNIKITTATIKWNHLACVKFYSVQFRKSGVTTWTIKNTAGNKDSINLTGLTANTKYEFRVASKDSANKIIATSQFTAIGTFTTKASSIIASISSSSDLKSISKESLKNKNLSIYPNPATNSFTVQTNGVHFKSVKLLNANGVVVWSASSNILSENNKLNVNVSNISAGTYFLVLVDLNNKQHMEKIVVEK